MVPKLAVDVVVVTVIVTLPADAVYVLVTPG
jgi:hypothetical protein